MKARNSGGSRCMRRRFVIDHMLGRLARYLRFMGYDVHYPTGRESDDALIERARREGRVIITRDRGLSERCETAVYVPHHDIGGQLVWFFRTFGGSLRIRADRCTVCNSPLRPVSPEEVADIVPEGVLQRNSEFYRCDGCGRVYWWGTHAERMERDIEAAWKKALEETLSGVLKGEGCALHICGLAVNLYEVCGEECDDPYALCHRLAKRMTDAGFPSELVSVEVDGASFRAAFEVRPSPDEYE